MKYGVKWQKTPVKKAKWHLARNRTGKQTTWTSKHDADEHAASLRRRGYAAASYVIASKKPSLQTKVLNVARGLLGVMEQGGNNRGPVVSKIILANGGVVGEPWCGDFVAYCYRLAGSKAVTRSWAAVRLLGYVGGMRVLSKRKGRAGDIVCYTFDHTGLLLHYCNANGVIVPADKATHIKTIEGNTGPVGAVSDSTTGGDGVYEKLRSLELVARMVRVTR